MMMKHWEERQDAPSGLLIKLGNVLLEELPGDLGHNAGTITRVCIR
jgi:hypothetical protein